jgi:dynein heavy chain
MCLTNNVTPSKNFNLREVICDPLTIREWESNGLPGDDLSVENAILVRNGIKWPLMIDPQS